MTREDIIRMAREAGDIWEDTLPQDQAFLIRFAALVAAAERELIAAWVEDMCNGLDAKAIANGIRNGGNDDIQAFEVRK